MARSRPSSIESLILLAIFFVGCVLLTYTARSGCRFETICNAYGICRAENVCDDPIEIAPPRIGPRRIGAPRVPPPRVPPIPPPGATSCEQVWSATLMEWFEVCQ